eukprot:364524-Chlamydomonas_euryale.AAC.8
MAPSQSCLTANLFCVAPRRLEIVPATECTRAVGCTFAHCSHPHFLYVTCHVRPHSSAPIDVHARMAAGSRTAIMEPHPIIDRKKKKLTPRVPFEALQVIYPCKNHHHWCCGCSCPVMNQERGDVQNVSAHVTQNCEADLVGESSPHSWKGLYPRTSCSTFSPDLVFSAAVRLSSHGGQLAEVFRQWEVRHKRPQHFVDIVVFEPQHPPLDTAWDRASAVLAWEEVLLGGLQRVPLRVNGACATPVHRLQLVDHPVGKVPRPHVLLPTRIPHDVCVPGYDPIYGVPGKQHTRVFSRLEHLQRLVSAQTVNGYHLVSGRGHSLVLQNFEGLPLGVGNRVASDEQRTGLGRSADHDALC